MDFPALAARGPSPISSQPMTHPPGTEPSNKRLSSVLASFRSVSLNANALSRANLVGRRGSLSAQRLPTHQAQVCQDWVQVPEHRRATIDGAGPFWRQARGAEFPAPPGGLLGSQQREAAEWSPRHKRPSWMQARDSAVPDVDSRRSTLEALLPAIPTPDGQGSRRSTLDAFQAPHPASEGVNARRSTIELVQAMDPTLFQASVLQSALRDMQTLQATPDADASGSSVGAPQEDAQHLLAGSRRSTMDGLQLPIQTPSRADSRRSTMKCFPGMDAASFQVESQRSTMRSFPAHDHDDSRRSTAESLHALNLMSMQASSRRSTMERAQLAGVASLTPSREQPGRRPVPFKAQTLGKSPLSIPVDAAQSPGRMHFPEADSEFNRRETWHGGTTRSTLGRVVEGRVSEHEDRVQGGRGTGEVRVEIKDEDGEPAEGQNPMSPPSSQSRR